MYNGIFCGLTWITILPNDYQLGNKTDKKFNSLESHCRWITQVCTLLRNCFKIFERFIHFIWSNALFLHSYSYRNSYVHRWQQRIWDEQLGKTCQEHFCHQNFSRKLLTQSLKCKTHFLNVRTEFRVGNSFTCKCLRGSLTKFYY